MANGADRIELCSALGVGGLTPPYGLMEAAAALSRERGVPVVAMVRPRPGTFVYSAAEREVMKRDIAAAKRLGLAGVVLGVSRADGELDRAGIVQLVWMAKEGAPAFTVTLHRAVDLVPFGHVALETVGMINFAPVGSIDRVLTSGGCTSAWAGRDMIKRTVESGEDFAYPVSIMAGAGVNHENVAALVAATGVTEVHASCSAIVPPNEGRGAAAAEEKAAALGFVGNGPLRRTDGALVKALADVVHSL